MKKLLFILLPVFLLSSCTGSLNNEQLQKDISVLKNCDIQTYRGTNSPSVNLAKLVVSSSQQGFDYQFTSSLNPNAAEDVLEHVKVVLTVDQENYFFFGYDNDYTVVKNASQVNKEKRVYKGISINFTLEKKYTDSVVRITWGEGNVEVFGLAITEE